MPDLKISQLPVATTPLAGTELVPLVQGGVTVQSTVDKVLTGTVPSGTANGVLFLNGSKVVSSGSALTFDGTKLLASASASTTGEFNTTSSTAQVFNVTASNDAGTSIGLGVFGSAAATFGAITAGAPFLSTAAATMVQAVQNASGAFVWGIGATPNEQMRLTSTGLGIGTSSPTTKLHVTTSAASTAVAAFFNTDTSDGNGVFIRAGGVNSGKYALAVENASSSSLLLLDSSGNLGLGVTPSAWGSAYKALQVSTGSSYAASSNAAFWYSNAYNDNTDWRYITSTNASGYTQFGGTHSWFTAPSGTAGNAISFTQAMTLDASGNLLVGTTSGSEALEITRTGATSTSIVLNQTGTSGRKYIVASTGTGYGSAGNLIFYDATAAAERARVPAAGGMVVGTAALATTATDGFLYVPTCAGTPTGTPTTQTGTAPIVVDTTNNKLYFYSGGQWRDAGP